MEGIPQVIFNLQIPFDQYKTLCAGNFSSSVHTYASTLYTSASPLKQCRKLYCRIGGRIMLENYVWRWKTSIPDIFFDQVFFF